ncbi:MAG: TatD family hydrolase [Candidatus Helarchaeota archaeon]
MGVQSVISVAFYPIAPNYSETLEDLFRWMIERETIRLQAVGITGYWGIGIHPRAIPTQLDPKIFEVIERNMNGKVVALGEIGLEQGTRKEIEVLEQQLLLAKKKQDFPVILHTPGKNKREITKILIEILDSIEIKQGVLDHISLENLALALNTKFALGLTVQKGKLSIDQFMQIIRENEDQSERFLLNSDLGIDIAYKNTVPETIYQMEKEGINPEIIERIAYKNAVKLFDL